MAMNIDFILTAAQSMADKGEKEFALGLPTAANSFRTAAKQYRKAAAADPSRSQEFISLAETYEAKAGQNPASTPSNPVNPTLNAIRGPVTPQKGAPGAGGANNAQTQNQQQQTTATVAQAEDLTVEEAMAKLNALTGLTKVKEQVQAYVALMESFYERKQRGFETPDGFSYHLVFKGNPGTGKTTVARLMGQMFKSIGMLSSGHLVETSRSDLVAGYVGQTAEKTRKVAESALDGVLFVDEAYTLSSGGSNDFGQEAINELLSFMENNRERLIVIIAGYNEPIDKFIESNEGLTTRFTRTIEFEDYNPDELLSIFKGMCKKSQYELEPVAESMLYDHFKKLYANRDKHFGNARTARNIFQFVVEKQALRLQKMKAKAPDQITNEMFMKFTAEDVALVVGGNVNDGAVDYMRSKNDNSDSVIYGHIAQNNLGGAATALCSRLESLLKHVHHLEGDLSTMINQLRGSSNARAKVLTKDDFDVLYRIRTYRNAHVHSGSTNIEITPSDVVACLKVISLLE